MHSEKFNTNLKKFITKRLNNLINTNYAVAFIDNSQVDHVNY